MKIKWIPVKAFGIRMRECLTQSLRNPTFSHTFFLREDFLREWRSGWVYMILNVGINMTLHDYECRAYMTTNGAVV